MTQNNPSKEVKARKPKGSINWLKLGKDKDPSPSETVLLAAKRANGEAVYCLGSLKQIVFEGQEKKYVFDSGRDNVGEVVLSDFFTHYLSITPPVE